MNIYITFPGTHLSELSSALKGWFPENEYQLIETGTVLVSEGDLFECSVEPNAGELYLSGEVKLVHQPAQEWVMDFTQKLKGAFSDFRLDWEWEEGGNFREESFVHQV